MCDERSSCTVCDFSRINVYRRSDDGLQLQPKHVAVNKLIKTSDVLDWFNVYFCDVIYLKSEYGTEFQDKWWTSTFWNAPYQLRPKLTAWLFCLFCRPVYQQFSCHCLCECGGDAELNGDNPLSRWLLNHLQFRLGPSTFQKKLCRYASPSALNIKLLAFRKENLNPHRRKFHKNS